MENQYTSYYKNHSEKDLKEVISNSDSYEDEARLAAYYILKEKKATLTEEQHNEIKAIEEELIRRIRVKEAEEVPEVEESELQEWYSPTAVLGFTIFFSPLLGAILLSYNLKKANKKPQANYVIVIGVLFLLIVMTLAYVGKMNDIASMVISISSALIFLEIFWKKYLGYKTQYKQKSIKKVLIVVFSIMASLLGVYLYQHPEVFQKLVEIIKETLKLKK